MSINDLVKLGAAALILAGLMTVATAQTAPAPVGGPKCSAGTVQGQCVNPSLAATSIRRSVVMNASRVSRSALPVLPSEDWGYNDPVLRSDGRQPHYGVLGRSSNPNNIWGR